MVGERRGDPPLRRGGQGRPAVQLQRAGRRRQRPGPGRWGYGKANEVPPAVEKGVKDAHKQMNRVNLKRGDDPAPRDRPFGAARVVMLPASPGTGVIAGGAVRAVVQAAGITDILTKSYGSTNS